MLNSFYKMTVVIAITTLFTRETFAQTNWTLTGNSGTTPGTNFIGTTDSKGLSFKTNSKEAIRIDNKQNVGLGTASPAATLHIVPKSNAALQIDPYGSLAGNTGELHMTELATNGLQYVGFKAPDNITANMIWTLPASDGTSGQELSTDGTGKLSWVARAKTDLSNLKSPTAINTDLLPGLTNSSSLGSSTLRWKDLNLYNLKFADGTVQTTASPWTASSTGISYSSIVGVAGSAYYGYALNVNASSSNSGINIGDPVNNYSIFSTKSGSGFDAYFVNTNTSTTFPTLVASNSGSGAGVDGYSNNGEGVYGGSSSSYGVEGNSYTGDGVYGNGGYIGVYGEDFTGGYGGVYGYSPDGYGLGGQTSNSSAYGLVSFGYNGGYSAYFAGSTYSTGSYVTSDEKLKKNINDVSGAMDIIQQLHPKHYEFKNDEAYKSMNLPQGQHYGLLAQDLEQVLPGLVKDTKSVLPPSESKDAAKSGETTTDFKAVNYTELIPIMIKGMQEQQQTINDQQQQINNLMQQINDLKQGSSSQDKLQGSNSDTQLSGGLEQNAPNPFSQSTTIRFNLPDNFSNAQMVIHDAAGSIVKSISINQNDSQITLNAGELHAGTYFYSLVIDGKDIATKSMVLTK